MMNQDHFDWAVLAQQWIQKNSCIPNNSSDIPEPPPPPIISANVAQHLSKKYEEQGEADMEVVKDDDEIHQQQHQQLPSFVQINDGFSSASQVVVPPVWFGPPQSQQLPYCNPWNQWQASGNVVLPPPQLHIPPVTQINLVRDQVLPIPPLIKSDNSAPLIDETIPIIDAAKRKTLPAWIREGLEKMEREKLKQMEKIKTTDYPNLKKKSQWSDDDDDFINKSINYNSKLNEDESTVGSKPIKSSFAPKINVKSSPVNSDSENSADDKQSNIVRQKLDNKLPTQLQFKKSTKSYDEIMEELMLVVRRSLTEILLEVTNEEILNISQETYKKYKLKASSAQVFRKSALSSITGKLGLGAYADSGSSDENNTDNSDDENGKNSDQEKDSEDELRENIRNRQSAFKVIAQEIDSLASQEEARNEKTKERHSTERPYSSSKALYSVSGNNSGGIGNINSTLSSSISKKYAGDKEFGETHHTDKKSFSNGKRPKERTSRFSDNKDSRHKSASSSSHYLVPATTSVSTAPPAPSFLFSSQSKSSSHSTHNTKEFDEKSSSTSRKHRSSSSSSNESKSSLRRSSYRHRHRHDLEQSKETSRRKKSTRKDDRYSLSYKTENSSSSRKKKKKRNHDDNSSDSDDYHHRHRKNSSGNSDIKSSRKNRSRSRSKSKTTSIRSRSRSRSRSSYSSRRYDRF